MHEYLKNILPRIINYSKSLNETERLVNNPWCTVDHSGNQIKFVFLRDGRLLKIINGIVNEGKWEYFKSLSSLLVEVHGVKMMLKHHYFDDKALILSEDNFSDNFIVLANENLLPYSRLRSYIENLGQSTRIHDIRLANGTYIQVVGQNESTLKKGATIYQNGLPANGTFITESNLHLISKNGILQSIHFRKEIKTKFDSFVIISAEKDSTKFGDVVLRGNRYIENGWHKLSESEEILVIDGEIKDRKSIPRISIATATAISKLSKEKNETKSNLDYLVAVFVILFVIILIKCNV